LPKITIPLLSDLHISLANRSHLKAYIRRARQDSFPEGTGWKGTNISSFILVMCTHNLVWTSGSGLIHLKNVQDKTLAEEDRYIRCIIKLDISAAEQHDEDDEKVSDEGLQIVVCMSPEGSRRIAKAQYIQSDIGFKRVVGFHEFELASFDRDENTS
jgi:hypothetical protein